MIYTTYCLASFLIHNVVLCDLIFHCQINLKIIKSELPKYSINKFECAHLPDESDNLLYHCSASNMNDPLLSIITPYTRPYSQSINCCLNYQINQCSVAVLVWKSLLCLLMMIRDLRSSDDRETP